jgi:integrase
MTLEATWGEIDLSEAIWTVPARRMKTKREFRLPLSSAAMAVLGRMALLRRTPDPDAFIFPGGTGTGHLSNMTMLAVLKRLGRPDITTHGFSPDFPDNFEFPGPNLRKYSMISMC